MKNSPKTVHGGQIEQSIFLIRGAKVMLSTHLAELYDVETRALVQAVKRNSERFPSDFMFQLTQEEVDALRSQNVILKPQNPSKQLGKLLLLANTRPAL